MATAPSQPKATKDTERSRFLKLSKNLFSCERSQDERLRNNKRATHYTTNAFTSQLQKYLFVQGGFVFNEVSKENLAQLPSKCRRRHALLCLGLPIVTST